MRVLYRSPKLFRHAGVYLKLWDKFYRVFKVGNN